MIQLCSQEVSEKKSFYLKCGDWDRSDRSVNIYMKSCHEKMTNEFA